MRKTRRREGVEEGGREKKKQSEANSRKGNDLTFRRWMQVEARGFSSQFVFQATHNGRWRYRKRLKKHEDAESREKKGAKDAIKPVFARRAARQRRSPPPRARQCSRRLCFRRIPVRIPLTFCLSAEPLLAGRGADEAEDDDEDAA